MLIKMRTTMAGPDGVRLVDTVHDLPAAEAQPLLDGGYALPVGEDDLERAVLEQPEAETAVEAKPTKEQLPKWPLKSSPADYLERNPSGPKADLARAILDAEDE